MAIYRQIHTTYWKDRRVGDWEQSQKLFYLYLLTNDATTQCGVYEFNQRYAQVDLDMNKKEIKEHLDFLVKEKRIIYSDETEELMITNWLKYNSARSPKVAAVVDKELKNIKTFEFESEVIKKCLEYGYPIKTLKPKENTVSIPYLYPIDTISQPEPPPEPEPSHNHHHHQQEEKETVSGGGELNPYLVYQKNFGVLSPLNQQDIKHWVDDIGAELVIEAMRRAVLDQKSYRFATGIMRNWAQRNVKTMDDVKADDIRHANNKRNSYGNQGKRRVETKEPEFMRNQTEVEEKSRLTPERQAELDELMKRFVSDPDTPVN